MEAVIIAGGKGTRLGLNVPKPMADFGGKPLLEYQICLAKKYGIRKIIILTGFRGEVIQEYFKDGSKWDMSIVYSHEKTPLGTAGSLLCASSILPDRFLVLYGDIVFDMDLSRLICFDERCAQEALATIVVHPNDHPFDSDLIEIDDQNNVIKFIPKPHDERMEYNNLVNAGIYMMSKRICDFIPHNDNLDFGRDIFPSLIKAGKKMIGYRTPEYIKDMGTGDRFENTKADLLSGKVASLNLVNPRPAIFLDRDGVINREVDNLSKLDDFELLPKVSNAIRMINKSKYLSIVVTNQPVVAKGFIELSELLLIHKRMECYLGRDYAYLDDIIFCPHHPESGFPGEVSSLKRDCDCRKPKPGMLLTAAARWNIDLKNSWLVGDHERDIQAALSAGVKSIYVGSGHCDLANMCEDDLISAVKHILGDHTL